MYESSSVYKAANVVDLSEFETIKTRKKMTRFEEAMEFYEAAIESAQKYGFQQYEALGIQFYTCLFPFSFLVTLCYLPCSFSSIGFVIISRIPSSYNVKGLELYGIFWITAPDKPHIRFALMYLSEAIMAYERWGATAKAQQLRKHLSKISTYDPNILNKPIQKVLCYSQPLCIYIYLSLFVFSSETDR